MTIRGRGGLARAHWMTIRGRGIAGGSLPDDNPRSRNPLRSLRDDRRRPQCLRRDLKARQPEDPASLLGRMGTTIRAHTLATRGRFAMSRAASTGLSALCLKSLRSLLLVHGGDWLRRVQ